MSLVDYPIAGNALLDLSSNGATVWTATATATSGAAVITIPASVPGDLITDLYQAGLIEDPLHGLNFKNASLWEDNVWVYSTTFDRPALLGDDGDDASFLLVFDGVKMGASVALNGEVVGTVVDQFNRYVFPMTTSTLLESNNTLDVTFDSAMDVDGRFMACTGGWDWAPYSTTTQPPGNQSSQPNTFSKGIWKSVAVVGIAEGQAAVTHVVPHTFYNGSHPTEPLAEHDHGDFSVEVRVHFWAPSAVAGLTLVVAGDWSDSATATLSALSLPEGDSNVTVTLSAKPEDILLWWPIGLGAQPLYNVSVSLAPSALENRDDAAIATERRIGFRDFRLVTGNDTDPAWVKNATGGEGTDSHGMLFRVNGAAVWSKGANMIPMEELEGRLNADAHRYLVRSSAEAGMNTLRVWGGGIFLPDAWYDACDEWGILVYHDMAYAQEGHAPHSCSTQDAELRHQVRRLSHHPSIVLWDGCNECQVKMGTSTEIYATFVMTVVAEEDRSRSVWPSCPALGWTTGVDTLSARPNGNALTTPDKGTSIETHGPYQHGAGFPSVNGQTDLALFDADIPITISATETGTGLPNVFASEFGAVVMSSFESMAPTLDQSHWGLHAGMPGDNCTGSFTRTCVGDNPMSDRNYPCDNIVDVYFGEEANDFNATGEFEFKQQLWQCLIGQALEMKSNIETRRASNSFGTIVWQLNEIWPTGGWGSLEYGTPVDGQVIGGRWKPLHYFYRASVFADVMATCGGGGVCYVKNDRPFSFDGSLTISSVSLTDGDVAVLLSKDLSMTAGAGVTEWFTLDGWDSLDASTTMLVLAVTEAKSGDIVSTNTLALAPPVNLTVPSAAVRIDVADAPNDDGSVDITLTSDVVAVYTTLTTYAQGRFSDNAFLLVPPSKTVQFVPFGALDLDLLKREIRVEHIASYRS